MRRQWTFLIVAMLVVGFAFVLTIHDFLAITQRVEANVLVVEGWVSNHTAIREAAEEFKKGQYKLLITVGGPIGDVEGSVGQPSAAILAAGELQELGVDNCLIVTLTAPTAVQHRTYTGALTLKDWLRESEPQTKTVNIFTIGSHARKSLVLFRKALGPHIDVGVIAGTDDEYNPDYWWMSIQGNYVIFRNLLGYLYAVTWPFPENSSPKYYASPRCAFRQWSPGLYTARIFTHRGEQIALPTWGIPTRPWVAHLGLIGWSSSPGTVSEFVRSDVSSLAEVRDLASRITHGYEQVDVLINNAGAWFSRYEETSDGVERSFATNHLGHFLLTALLLERLMRAPEARILTIGSGAHGGIYSKPAWVLTRTAYDHKLAYGTSKLANIVFSYELARRLSGTTVTSNAVDPGEVATNLGRNNGVVAWLRHVAYYAWKGQLITACQAAEHIAYVVLAKELAGVTGTYFHERKPVQSSTTSQDLAIARELWSLSVKLSGIDASIGQVWRYMRPADSPWGFRSAIWLGCTSNSRAGSAGANLALNTTECVRLVLFAIVCSIFIPP
jgi:NAD(P)-dependent dehydrogenase (short-subunit alcohol dehydrogenase family)